MFEFISFYLFSILIIFCFAVVVLSSNILYAMTALASGMIFISGIFFTLGAEFLGVVQISVYTGAVMALYAFGMMFFDSAKEVEENIRWNKIACVLSFGIAVMLVVIISLPRLLSIAQDKIDSINNTNIEGNVEQIGIVLFTKFLVPFEIAALMLLIAMIAGIALASKKIGNQIDNENIPDEGKSL
ncbi:NADH:ubiquinone oxidoreductase subunit J [Helicobacter sp. 16-1353]|uniref:NADH-quinone oxidoreductase subunit J n=1 Tax=Helicobacter sp. 16-1353 TaxID=2004996 RepID=UPI000DCE57C2|nr:NADH-quinone oxidoreductase subunit J [Helicobacter sp. 16-1353]RAX54929.1 NADH:ubiquinone oxidoreductase subunit J [Helicobacter sp. 16-1353]